MSFCKYYVVVEVLLFFRIKDLPICFVQICIIELSIKYETSNLKLKGVYVSNSNM